MYISYINKKSNEIITRNTGFVTERNEVELEKRISCFLYLYDKAVEILEKGDISARYRTNYILKKNKKYRRIDIPDEDLMMYQKQVVQIFSEKLELIFPQSVYGYVKGRNTKAMAEVHKNRYLVIKLDIKDFFFNCTFEFIMNSMATVYPFCLLDRYLIETIIMPCMVFYDGDYRLPQGAPTSPILSNIAMIPIDHELECMRGINNYTRFADDIIISHDEVKGHDITDVIFGIEPKVDDKKCKKIAKEKIQLIEKCLKEHNPKFKINQEKTKVLKTQCGNVWMLGISVGEEVKIGNKRKQRLKATIWSFLNDCKNGNPWTKQDTAHMLGILGYGKHIEPNFIIELIKKYEQKTEMNFKEEVKKIMC